MLEGKRLCKRFDWSLLEGDAYCSDQLLLLLLMLASVVVASVAVEEEIQCGRDNSIIICG